MIEAKRAISTASLSCTSCESGTCWQTAMRCNTLAMSSRVEAADRPLSRKLLTISKMALPSPTASASIMRNTALRSTAPSIWRTCASFKLPAPKAIA